MYLKHGHQGGNVLHRLLVLGLLSIVLNDPWEPGHAILKPWLLLYLLVELTTLRQRVSQLPDPALHLHPIKDVLDKSEANETINQKPNILHLILNCSPC